MANPNPRKFPRLEQRLRQRREELRRHIRSALADTGRKDFTEIIGRVRDPGEESVAELAASTNLTLLEREVNELRDVEVVLDRMREGTYGACLECGGPIDPERLEAYPAAKRCFECQRNYEAKRAGGRDLSPSL